MEPLKTMKELVAELIKTLSEEDLEEIKLMDESELNELHFGLGMYLRNEFNLYSIKELRDAGDMYHPDSASMIVIEALHKELNKGKNE